MEPARQGPTGTMCISKSNHRDNLDNMTWSAKETIAFCALAILAGNIVDTSYAQWAPPETHFDFSEVEGQYQYLTVDGYWTHGVDKQGAKDGRRRKLKVRRPGRHSNDAKAAAVSLMDIASTTSFQVPAPTRTPVRTPVQSTANKQMKRKAADCNSDPQASRSPSPAYEPAAMAASPLSRAEGCPSCPASPLAPTTPSPSAAERGSKRARRMPAAMADYMFE